MKLLDRITGKDKILREMETLRGSVQENNQALGLAHSIAERAMAEARDLREANEKWISLGAGDDNHRELDDAKRNTLREMSTQAYYKTPEGKAAIRSMVQYIMGKAGVNWTAHDENPDVQEFIDDFAEAPKVQFSRRHRSIIRRTLRDGECFIHMLGEKKGRITALRFYHPSEISKIETDPNDSETPVTYVRTWMDESSKTHEEKLPAADIVHIKYDVDEDVLRGRPFLEPVLKRITQHEDWLEGRIKTNRAKSSIFLEKVVEGSPNRVASVKAGLPTPAGSRFADDEYAVQAPKYGTVAVHSKTIEYKWVEPKINADDCKEDGRQMRLSIAAGVGLPEYLLTGDASNAAYASTTVAESPFIQQVEDHRTFFEEEFKLLFARVIRRGIDGGVLPSTSTETVMKESALRKTLLFRAMKEKATDDQQAREIDAKLAGIVKDEESWEQREVPTKTGVDFEWPSVVTRNLWEETQSIQVHVQEKWCSRRTAQMKFGYDPEEEERIIEKESQSVEDEAYNMNKKQVEDQEDQDEE